MGGGGKGEEVVKIVFLNIQVHDHTEQVTSSSISLGGRGERRRQCGRGNPIPHTNTPFRSHPSVLMER